MEKNALRIVVVISICCILLTLPRPVHAALKVSISVAEGYLALFPEGEAVPGPASTRFSLALGWPISDGWGASFLLGVAIPNTELKPWPRVILGIGHKLTDSLGIGGGVLYQLNYGYGGAKTTHLVGAGLGPSLKLGKRVSVGLQMGPAKTLGKKGLWSFLIQPGLSYTFP